MPTISFSAGFDKWWRGFETTRMTNLQMGTASPQDFRTWKFVRQNFRTLLLWPAICLLLIALLWGLTLVKIGFDRADIRQDAFKDATYLLNAYSEQLSRSVDQINQITLNLKYYWQKTHGAFKLEEQLEQGLYPHTAQIYVMISDRDGRIVSSTIDRRGDTWIADRDYFLQQKNATIDALLISPASVGRVSGKSVIRFTRRLVAPDGSFDGVVMVAVEPSYFASFSDEASLGKCDFLLLSHDGAGLLSAKMGERIRPLPAIFRSTPQFTQSRGVRRFAADQFVDSEPRIIGWQRLQNYPLTALVGVSENTALTSYRETAASYRNIAVAGSAFLLLLAVASVFASARLTWRKQQAEEVNATYHMAIDAAREGFYMLRAQCDQNKHLVDLVFADCNERGAYFFGRSKEDMIGVRFTDLYTGEYLEKVLAEYRNAMEANFREDELEIPAHSPLRVKWVYRKIVRSGDGLAVTIRDISDIKAHERALSQIANTDALTGLPNRHWFMNFLPTALQNAMQHENMLAILFVDLDNFKDINDTLGHQAGDELLRIAAVRLRALLRPTDQVVRLGGDEFTVVLSAVLSRDEVAQAADRINQAFLEPFEIMERKNVVQASIGISMFPIDGSSTETLLKNADIAMYAAKAESKGKYRFYDARLYERIKTRLDTEQELLHAIKSEQFVMHYQPRVIAATGEMIGMEALVRWQHPVRGMVPPNDFIPLAESTGLILPLGELVMKMVCAQMVAWQEMGVPVLPVSVNVSARQLDAGVVEKLICSCLAEYKIDPALLEIELTESAMIGESEATWNELAAINALGVKIHVDDFGTGYSSLALLHKLDVDILKVDRAFTAQLGDGADGEIFFKAIVSMARALDMRVIAEGVETEAQLRSLQRLECDEVQGFLVSRPVPARDIPALIEKRCLLADPLL
jgi:diguanylate cyclase (GGDEF)-like protein